MHPDLIAYASGSLDDPARARFEAQLRGDAELRRQLDIVRRRLVPLRADAAHDAPPPGLLISTLAFVAEHACQDLPAAPAETTISRPTFERPWWRRVDALVAASIAVTVVGRSAD